MMLVNKTKSVLYCKAKCISIISSMRYANKVIVLSITVFNIVMNLPSTSIVNPCSSNISPFIFTNIIHVLSLYLTITSPEKQSARWNVLSPRSLLSNHHLTVLGIKYTLTCFETLPGIFCCYQRIISTKDRRLELWEKHTIEIIMKWIINVYNGFPSDIAEIAAFQPFRLQEGAYRLLLSIFT